jgi:hypothetical protein
MQELRLEGKGEGAGQADGMGGEPKGEGRGREVRMDGHTQPLPQWQLKGLPYPFLLVCQGERGEEDSHTPGGSSGLLQATGEVKGTLLCSEGRACHQASGVG